MREVKIEELKAGDEIVISCQSYFKYLRLLVDPATGKKKHWKTGVPLYKSVKCSTIRITTQKTYTSIKGQPTIYYVHRWGFGSDDHNHINYVDLTDRQILLIKEKQE